MPLRLICHRLIINSDIFVYIPISRMSKLSTNRTFALSQIYAVYCNMIVQAAMFAISFCICTRFRSDLAFQ